MPHRAYARQYVIYLTIVCGVPWIVAALVEMGMSNLLFVMGLTFLTVSGLTLGIILLVELVAWASKSFWRAIVALYGWQRSHSLPVPE